MEFMENLDDNLKNKPGSNLKGFFIGSHQNFLIKYIEFMNLENLNLVEDCFLQNLLLSSQYSVHIFISKIIYRIKKYSNSDNFLNGFIEKLERVIFRILKGNEAKHYRNFFLNKILTNLTV
jgi:hypothetical protein